MQNEIGSESRAFIGQFSEHRAEVGIVHLSSGHPETTLAVVADLNETVEHASFAVLGHCASLDAPARPVIG
jgi:hypothetical protein